MYTDLFSFVNKYGRKLGGPAATTQPAFCIGQKKLKGIGPQLAQTMARFFGAPEGQDAILLDLLMHMPAGIVDRRQQPGAAFAQPGAISTFLLTIDQHQVPPRGNKRLPYRIIAHDDTGEIMLTYFAGARSVAGKTFARGVSNAMSPAW